MNIQHDLVTRSFKSYSRKNVFLMWAKVTALVILAVSCLVFLSAQAQDKTPTTTTSVRMTVTVRQLDQSRRMPEVRAEDVIVKQGKDRLRVTGWTPARGDKADLELFILIDDASEASLGSQLDDIRSFIKAQPQTASVGVGYMRNATVQIIQNFTTDHEQTAKAVRLPLTSVGAFGSPFLSVIDLMKRWPAHASRREVIMVTDGVDRARGGPRSRASTNPDVDRASDLAQRTGTMIHTIFFRGAGRLGNNFWEINNGQNWLARLSDETGGESFYLGMQNPVSFRPYFEDIQKALDNQYLLQFDAIPGKKSGLQSIKLTTEVAGVELDSADSVWVEAK